MTIAALVQLKVIVRNLWSPYLLAVDQNSISPGDRDYLTQALLPTIANLCDNYKSAQLLMDIVKLVGRQFCSTLIFTI